MGSRPVQSGADIQRLMDITAPKKSFALRMGLVMAAGLGLSGCATMLDPYGSSVSVGVGYGSGYADPYYDPYYGWYDDYYYPGAGQYVYDRRGARHQWNDRLRGYWLARRGGHRQYHENWDGYSRGNDGYYRDHRRRGHRNDRQHRGDRYYRGDRRDRDERHGRHDRREERGERGRQGNGFADGLVRKAAEAAARGKAREERRERATPRRDRQSVAPSREPQSAKPSRAPRAHVAPRQVEKRRVEPQRPAVRNQSIRRDPGSRRNTQIE